MVEYRRMPPDARWDDRTGRGFRRGTGAGGRVGGARDEGDEQAMIATQRGIAAMVRGISCLGLALALVAGTGSARGDEEPWRLVDWKPIAGNPVFTGTGGPTWDREIRERGYIL